MSWLSFAKFWGAPQPVPYPPEPSPSHYAEAVLKVAIGELGNGEEGGNNRGPDLDRYRRGGPGGAWCAAFVAYCLEVGAVESGLIAERGPGSYPVKRSHGAKNLFANAVKVGTKVARPAARDLVCWNRGVGNTWQGHIGIVSRVDGAAFWSIEGNVGGGTDRRTGLFVPSRVREYLHEIGEARLVGFARLP